jgi:hypothetical protein
MSGLLRAAMSAFLATALACAGGSPQASAPGDAAAEIPDGPPPAATAAAPPDAGGPDAGGSLPPDPCVAAGTCPPDTWVNVTPMGITIPASGLRSVVPDPARPTDLYLGSGEAGIWKSVDYGNTWTMIHKGFGYVPQGLCIAVLPTRPATILVAASGGGGKVHKSTDGGATFRTTGGGLASDFYSFAVDPYDGTHLVSGFHERDGLAESTDAGETWRLVGGAGFPGGGISWYPSFIDTGDAATTRRTWIAIAQNGGSVTVTRDGGASWTIPAGIQGLQHPHGNAQIFQRGATLFVPGIAGPGSGVYRSTDWGASFARVSASTQAAVAWGTPSHVYSMYAWSCFGCAIDPNFMVGSATGEGWTKPGVPKTMAMGADHVAVTSDGSHHIFVAAMRNSGLWRYVER